MDLNLYLRLQKSISASFFQVLTSSNPELMSGTKILLTVENQLKVKKSPAEIEASYKQYLNVKKGENHTFADYTSKLLSLS